MDPDRFLGPDKVAHLARAEALFADMSEQGARIPGERRFQQRQYSEQHGVTIPQALYEEIAALCR
jgi:delta1-piperideine-2-carboxylate reductase